MIVAESASTARSISHREEPAPHDGKYITSAGGAKSFEAALYLAEYLYGKTIAESLAGGLVIDWDIDNVPHLIIDK